MAGVFAVRSIPLSAALPVAERHWDAVDAVVAEWDGTVSYSHWQGRLLDEAKSMGLRRYQREGGQILQAVCRAILSLSRSGMFVWAFEPRRGARDAPGMKLLCGTRQAGLRSRHRCDTLSGRVSRRNGEDVERIGGEIWRRLEETATKSGGEGGSNNSRREPHQAVARASPTARSSQLHDWSDSPGC